MKPDRFAAPSDNPSDMYCISCRSLDMGISHCAHPEDCGGMEPMGIKCTDDEFLVQMLGNGGTWPDRPIAHTNMGRRLMQKGLIELVKPDPDDYPGYSVPLPYARLTKAGERRARVHDGQDSNV